MIKKILDHGYVKLLNISGPVRRPGEDYDADSIDPAIVARNSFDNMNEERTRAQDMKLVSYLLQNQHTSPIEQIVVWLDMKMPIFIARQLIRHRTARPNEVSARYTQLKAEWYIPELKNVGVKSKSNKQGRDMTSGVANTIKAWLFTKSLNLACWSSYQFYRIALWSGIPPELSRCFLHVNHYTHWAWQHDLHNLLHLIRLRRHGHAQYEVRVLADAIYEILHEVLPEFMKLWDELEADKVLANALLIEHKEHRKLHTCVVKNTAVADTAML